MAKEASTQSHLDIDDIQEDLVVLKNGNIALLIETNSLNFDLLSEKEQEVRIDGFSALLNSLEFPLQIVIRTERADVSDYLDHLRFEKQKQSSKAIQKQMEIYIKFIKNLTTKTDILNKRFFLVINTNFTIAQNKSLLGGLFGGGSKKQNVSMKRAKDYLYPKRDYLLKQIKKMGLKAVQLNNDQLVQLFYDIYDPDKVGIKKVDLSEDYTADLVGSSKPTNNELVDELLEPGKGGNNG